MNRPEHSHVKLIAKIVGGPSMSLIKFALHRRATKSNRTSRFGHGFALMIALACSTLSGVATIDPPDALAQSEGPDVRERGDLGEEIYAAGRWVDLKGQIEGDAIVAGGRLKVGEEISGDATLAGGIVTLTGKISDDVRVAGGDVDIDALVSDDLMILGGNVVIQETTRVDGDAWIAAGNVDVFGDISQDLEIVGGTVRLGGGVGGDVKVASGQLEILPSARIAGELNYTSANDAVISPSAIIGGPINRELSAEYGAHGTVVAEAGVGASIIWILALTVVGLILILGLPQFIGNVTSRFMEAPWKSLAIGFVALVVIPVLAIFSIVVIIGIPVGLLLLTAYPIVLLVAYVTAATWLGDSALSLLDRVDARSWYWRTGALFATLVVLSVVGLIPIVGGLVLFLTLIGGLGAWAIVIGDRLRAA